jgi:hypothetical protein
MEPEVLSGIAALVAIAVLAIGAAHRASRNGRDESPVETEDEWRRGP